MGSSGSIQNNQVHSVDLLAQKPSDYVLNEGINTLPPSNGDANSMFKQNYRMAMSKSSLLLNALGLTRTVKYIPQIMGVKENKVKVWWFPQDFCQSRLGDRVIGSNACTLIAVLLAHRIHFHKITIRGEFSEPLSEQLTSALAESIVDGNEIYESLQKMGELHYDNLTLTEAIKYYEWVKDEIKLQDRSLDKDQINCEMTELNSYVLVETSLKEKLFDVCHRGIMEWEINNKVGLDVKRNLFLVLIAGERSVLLVYQRHRRQVTLIDSHSHHNHGAVVSQTNVNSLNDLCDWYDSMSAKYHSSNPTAFEVSFLHYQ